MKRKLAVIGALNAVGRAILDCLAARGFEGCDVYAIDLCQQVGTTIPFRSGFLRTFALETFDFSTIGIAFLCTPSILTEYKDKMLSHGQYLIDCVGIIGDVPCIIAPLNMPRLKDHHLISNPTGLSITLAQVLKPIHQSAHIRWADATALLSAGEFGNEAVQALVNQTRSLYTQDRCDEGPFGKIQAFNLIPEIYPLLARRSTWQIKNILQIPVQISTCLTPVFQGECYALTVVTRRKMLCSDIEELFSHHTICRVVRQISPYATLSTQDTTNSDHIYLTHIETVPYQANTYHLWIICDSLRMGTALNAVLIAEHILS